VAHVGALALGPRGFGAAVRRERVGALLDETGEPLAEVPPDEVQEALPAGAAITVSSSLPCSIASEETARRRERYGTRAPLRDC
jgi:hypothetical protein